MFCVFIKKTKQNKIRVLASFLCYKRGVMNFYFQTKGSYILNEGRHFQERKRICLIKKCIFLSKIIWSRKFSASSLLFPVRSHGIKHLISNRRKRPKIPKSYISTYYHMSVNFSFSFLLLQLACMFLLRQSRIRNSQKFIINLYSGGK